MLFYHWYVQENKNVISASGVAAVRTGKKGRWRRKNESFFLIVIILNTKALPGSTEKEVSLLYMIPHVEEGSASLSASEVRS